MSERVDKNIMNAGEPSDEDWLQFIKRDDDEQLMIDSDSLRLIVGQEINEQVEVIDLVDEQDDEVMEVNVEEQFEDANNSGEETVIQEEIHQQVDVIDLVDEEEDEVMEVNGEEEVEDANNSGEQERREKRKFDKRALLNLRMQKLELKIKAYKKKFINKRGLNQQESTSQLEHANNAGQDTVIQDRQKRKCDKKALLANCWTCFCWIEEGDIIWRCERRHVICNLCKSKMNNSCSCENPVNERDTKWENLIKDWDK